VAEPQENKIELRLALVESANEGIMTRLQELEHTLDGNGSIGVKTRVLIMWHTHYWLWGAVGMVLGGALVRFFGMGGT